MGLWKCERVSCPNHDKGGWCFDVDGVHLKLMMPHIRSWSMAINNEEATLDTPPTNLPSTLMPARSSDVNPFRKAKKSSPPPSSSNTSTSTIMTPSFIPFPMPGYSPYPSMYPSLPGINQSIQQSSTMPMAHAPSCMDPEDINTRSSLPTEIDPVERLHRYFTWLMSKSPSQVEMFTKAKIAALKAGHTFSTIFKVSDNKWAQWDIEDGIVMQIRMGESKFRKVEPSFNA
jgi:hypothetical protein